MTQIGFIGLGALGGRMAAKLAEAGHELRLFARHPESARGLVDERGAQLLGSPREVAEAADVVFTCLPTEDAAREVVLGDDGVAAGMREGSGLVECSTVAPEVARELADGVRAKGAEAIDASVSGSTIPAEKGALVFVVGGDRGLYDRCGDLLEPLAKATFFMGDSGNGAITKLAVNTMLGTAMQALAEAWTLGVAAGLDRDALAEVLSANATVGEAHQPKVASLKDGSYDPQFALRLMHKDFDLIAQLARQTGAVMPATAVAAQMNAAEMSRGEDEDFAAVGRLIAQLSGLDR